MLEKENGNAAVEEPTVTQDMVDKLRMALEDMTAVCILEGFQKQEHLMLVDSLLKELGILYFAIFVTWNNEHLKVPPFVIKIP
jgi:hypothetical protein